MFLVISSSAFSGIMSGGHDGMGSYAGIVILMSIIKGTGSWGLRIPSEVKEERQQASDG